MLHFDFVSNKRTNLGPMEEAPENTPMVTGATVSIVDGNASSEPQSPEKTILTKEGLAKRDREAVAYSKALLVEGDTLIYITYPGDSKCFDSTGFEISAAPHRVHSSRLLATGSKVFAKLLSPTSQYRTIRRKKLVGNLPNGIKYVLDLTPPDEGDEAVELTSELSCSLGVRLWYTAAQRCGISHNLVGGKDEIIDARKIASYGSPASGSLANQQVLHTGAPENPSKQVVNEIFPSTLWESHENARQDKEIADAVRMSLEEWSKSKAKKAGLNDPLDVPDYCPVRHRAGIGRLLRVLEGKDPHLDSAPKVWTLFVLAKYFECTAAVVDWIVSWVIADPNTQFIEILPEASCKMAFGLKNQMICRAAFSILVSEEALSLASREIGRVDADRQGTNQFSRIREDIDEDLRTRIEYASKTFASRVCETFEALAGEEMQWVTKLPEYQKLQKFKNVVLSYVGNGQQATKWLSAVNKLASDLRKHVHSRILAYLRASLTNEKVIIANSHRRAERYTNPATSYQPNPLFSVLYDKLNDKERIFTRFFWSSVLYSEFPISFHSVQPSNSDSGFSEEYLLGVKPTASDLRLSRKQLNESIIEAIATGLFNDGIMPPEVGPEYTQSYAPSTHITENDSYVGGAMSRDEVLEARHTMKSWNPFSVFKCGLGSSEASTTEVEKDNSATSYDWNTSTTDIDRNAWTAGEDATPLIPREARVVSASILDKTRSFGNASWDSKDVDEYLALYHLLKPIIGLEKAATSGFGSSVTTSDLPLRPKADVTISPAQGRGNPPLYGNERASFQVAELSQPHANYAPNWTSNEPYFGEQAREKLGSRWNAESHLSLVMQKSPPHENLTAKGDLILHPVVKSPLKARIPGDDKIPAQSPFFNMSKLFLEAKDHIRDIATAMLDQREMGFDVALTDTLVSLGPEEFKYLPLWAGGDDDGSGGVFEDTIPVAWAGPNGPGPSYHTGFSSASTMSSEFDTMSDRTAFKTSIAVEDGHSDHIDRRLIVADDNFHSETFSEDSSVYDRKGKGIDRSGFVTSHHSSEAAFSVADTMSDSASDINTPDVDSNFEMDYEEDDSDADTTVGQGDDENDDEAWNGGDTESFDFGDSDEEMTNI